MSHLIYSTTRTQGKSHPQWSTTGVIYEMNVRQFTASGTFAAAAKHLPRLKALGVDVIWMMPIFPIGIDRRKGDLGSYYSIKDYCAVNEEFGEMDDFHRFVDSAHSEGIKVILDWVANHTSRDAVWVEQNPSWYEWDSEKGEIATPFDWSDTAKLNYDNADMRQGMIDALKFWLSNSAIDGYRMDMAMLMPIDFWRDAISQMQVIRPDIFLLAEAQGPEFHTVGFDATYSWDIHHLMNDIARGNANADRLCNMLRGESMTYSSKALRMNFTSNHDENSWNGTEFERMGAAAFQMAVLTYILPGMPLIYTGQEAELSRRLEFFDKDCVDWHNGTFAEKLYTALGVLRHSHPALAAGGKGGDLQRMNCSDSAKVLTVKRVVDDKIVIALFNFSSADAWFKVWDEDFAGQYNQLLSSQTANLTSGTDFFLPPNGWFVYYK